MGSPTKRTDANRATGRPTKRTRKVEKAIVEAILDGATFTLAAAAGGISYDTFNEWRKTFPDFPEMVDAAVAESGLFHMRNIKQHAYEDWRASAWVMEHRFTDDYGKSIQEHRGEQALNITISKRSARDEASE